MLLHIDSRKHRFRTTTTMTCTTQKGIYYAQLVAAKSTLVMAALHEVSSTKSCLRALC